VSAQHANVQIPEDLFQRINAFQESRTILSAIELDLFTAVGGGSTAAQVAEKIQADARAAEMLLNAVVACGLLVKSDGRFQNTPLSERFLVAGAPADSRAALVHYSNMWRSWSKLTDAVRAGGAVGTSEIGDRGREWTEPFIAAMHHHASQRAPLVVEALGANRIRRMLDVGGGSGAYSIAFARANSELHAEVLDLAAVLPITTRYIEQSGVGRSVSARAGDLRRDRLGANYDLVFVSSICHMLSVAENRDLIKRCFEATAPGGRTVIQDFILDPDKTAPKQAAIFSLNMLVATPAGASYSIDEYTAWLAEAGFTPIERKSMSGPADLMIGVRPAGS
jgi:ubiquinone/menaquinone biosynthesis C-methylase UbiE